MENVDVSQLLEIVLENDYIENLVDVESTGDHIETYNSRSRNEGNWKRNKAKFLKNSGQSYVSVHSGKIVLGKEFLQVNKCCVKDCHKLFSPATQKLLFTQFYETGNYNQQNEYLISQIKVIPVARPSSAVKAYTRQYYLTGGNGNELKVCKTFFQSILHVSGGRLDRVLRKKVNSIPPIDNRGRRPHRISSVNEKTQEILVLENEGVKVEVGNKLYMAKFEENMSEKIATTTKNLDAILRKGEHQVLLNKNDETSNEVFKGLTCTNRQRNEANWKKNKRKFLRNSGQSYVSARGKLVPGKVFTLVDKCCVNNCHKLFSPSTQEFLFTKFYENGNYNQQNEYIFSQIEVTHINGLKSIKTVTNKYYLADGNGRDTKVCKTFFKSILRVSDGRLARLMRKKISLDPPVDNRGRRAGRNEDKEVNEEYFLENVTADESEVTESERIGKDPVRKQDDGSISTEEGDIEHDDYSQIQSAYRSNCNANSKDKLSCKITGKGQKTTSEILAEDNNSPKCRKRLRNEASWARNQRKSLRNSGKSYINLCGNVVPGKIFAQINNCCINNCYQQFSSSTQELLFTKFYESGNYNQQNQYLVSQVKIISTTRLPSSVRLYTRHYYLADENGCDKRVCKVFFQGILHVSGGRLDRALRKKINSAPIIDNRGRHNHSAITNTGKLSSKDLTSKNNNSEDMGIIILNETQAALHHTVRQEEVSSLVTLTDLEHEVDDFQNSPGNINNYVNLKRENEDLSDLVEFPEGELEDRYFEDSLKFNSSGETSKLKNVELKENQSLLRHLLLVPNEIINGRKYARKYSRKQMNSS